jgi:S1-C subfamily serine protease
MPIELRVLSGSRIGQREVLDLPVIAVGRHPQCDFRFDAMTDLDVSARHAELRAADGGGWVIRDGGSTNGTFVNGRRVQGVEQPLRDGDVISFGEQGPRVEIHGVGSGVSGGGAGAAPAVAPTAVNGAARKRPSTDERVAVAVRKHTKGMRLTLAAVVLVLGAGVGIAYWIGHRESRAQLTELMQVLAQSESTTIQLQRQLVRVGDTSFANALRRQSDEMAARIRSSSGGASKQQLMALRDEVKRSQALQQGLALMDVSSIAERNDPGIAFLVTELDGKAYGSTAFGVTREGLLVTNRHNVRTELGAAATRVGVKYANTDNLRRARVVKVSDDKDVDLALVQVEEAGIYPIVTGVAASVDSVRTGAPVVTIGFPHALDTPMDGNLVKTTLAGGTVSKKIPSLLQIDSYASHGSSGSPVFDTNGYVIGVIWGGAPASQGRIVYAVPSDRIASFLPKEAAGILKD